MPPQWVAGLHPQCTDSITATPRGPGGLNTAHGACAEELSSSASRRQSRRGVTRHATALAHQLAQGFLLTAGTGLGLVHNPSEHFLLQGNLQGLVLQIVRLSKWLCTCQLLPYHLWWRRKSQGAACLPGEDNAFLPHDKSPCETWFLLHKETVPHFSRSLILSLLMEGKGFVKCLQQKVEVPAAAVRVWWYLYVRELLAAWRKSSFLKVKGSHAPAPADFLYSFMSVGFQHNSLEELGPGCIGFFGNRTTPCLFWRLMHQGAVKVSGRMENRTWHCRSSLCEKGHSSFLSDCALLVLNKNILQSKALAWQRSTAHQFLQHLDAMQLDNVHLSWLVTQPGQPVLNDCLKLHASSSAAIFIF